MVVQNAIIVCSKGGDGAAICSAKFGIGNGSVECDNCYSRKG